MQKSPSDQIDSNSPSAASKAISIGGLVLLTSSLAMGVHNCSRNEVNYDKKDQAESARSAVGLLLGIDMRDECRQVHPVIGTENALLCDKRMVKNFWSPADRFHDPGTVREKIAANLNNCILGVLGLFAAGFAASSMPHREQEHLNNSQKEEINPKNKQKCPNGHKKEVMSRKKQRCSSRVRRRRRKSQSNIVNF